jgi:hypothetical protein
MDYAIALIYILLGAAGGSGHYLKKRYYDETTTCSFKDYLLMERKATIHALMGIVITEIGLSLLHTSGWHFPLGDIVGAITAGYTADSGLNKAPSK